MPSKKSTPSYVVELALDTTPRDERRLTGLMEAAKRLYNVVLQDGLDVVAALRADPAWEAARKLPRASEENRKARREAFAAVRAAHGFSEFAFHALMKRHRNASGLGERVGSDPAQKIASRVYDALNRYLLGGRDLLGGRGQPRFKGLKRPLHSVEGKAQRGKHLVWDAQAQRLHLRPDWSIAVRLPDLKKDEWLCTALDAPTKYCRLTWRNVRGHKRWFVQLVQEGLAPIKASLLARLVDVPKDALMGLDIGPSSIAWVSETEAGLWRFCAEVQAPRKLVRCLQRQVDRQRRAANPENFDEQGRALKGRRTWVKSGAQKRTEARLREVQAKLARQRANSHGRDINKLLERARHFRHDGVSVRSLQRNYGRSVAARAPGRFMSETRRKAERAGGGSETVNSWQLKTSQYDHTTGKFIKKRLSQRWHVFGDGRGRCQRDVYSAFLARNATVVRDENGVLQWSYDNARLELAWKRVEPGLQAQGLFVSSEGQSVEDRARIARQRVPRQPSSRKVRGSRPARELVSTERLAQKSAMKPRSEPGAALPPQAPRGELEPPSFPPPGGKAQL